MIKQDIAMCEMYDLRRGGVGAGRVQYPYAPCVVVWRPVYRDHSSGRVMSHRAGGAYVFRRVDCTCRTDPSRCVARYGARRGGQFAALAQAAASKVACVKLKEAAVTLRQHLPSLKKAINDKVDAINTIIKQNGKEIAEAILKIAYAAQPELLAIKSIPLGERIAKYCILKALKDVGAIAEKLADRIIQLLNEILPLMEACKIDELTTKIKSLFNVSIWSLL